jgi:hypothetical protein
LGQDVARRTQKIGLKTRISSWRSSKQARKKRLSAIRNWNWVAILKVAAVLCFLAASGAFLRYAEGYVNSAAAAQEGSLVLVGVPDWANWDLKNTVADIAGGTQFPLTEETASVVARNLAPMSWLDDIGVRVTHDAVRVTAEWRKPIAVIEIRETSSKIYVDQGLVVMDYMPMPHLPIVEAKGVSLNIVPKPGQVFDQGDVAAAVSLAMLLHRMDIEIAPKTPLLEQIASIEVGNYKGRKSPRGPHITLWAKDGTQIVWGAEIGEWAKYLEARDDEKLAKLYTHYKEFGSLNADGRLKYIDLRNPQDRVPRPIDKYR